MVKFLSPSRCCRRNKSSKIVHPKELEGFAGVWEQWENITEQPGSIDDKSVFKLRSRQMPHVRLRNRLWIIDFVCLPAPIDEGRPRWSLNWQRQSGGISPTPCWPLEDVLMPAADTKRAAGAWQDQAAVTCCFFQQHKPWSFRDVCRRSFRASKG